MMRELVFLPEVASDFDEGFNYYESLSPGRGGARFENAFKLALRKIEEGTVTHYKPIDPFHRVILPRFPYNLYYRIVENRAVITALLYARFDPTRIEGALKKRR
jgi:plasmid stabilization system protein ParE